MWSRPRRAMTDVPGAAGLRGPALLGYPRETVVAEKFEAMTKLGLLNSRMKDFYDLWLLSRQFAFDGATLASAIRRTFDNRKTVVMASPTALTPVFGTDAAKQTQWQAFLRKSKLNDVPTTLQSVIDELLLFLSPVAEAIEKRRVFDRQWGQHPVRGESLSKSNQTIRARISIIIRPDHTANRGESWPSGSGHTLAANCGKNTSGRPSPSTAGCSSPATTRKQVFVDLRDRYGLTQVVFESDDAELFKTRQRTRPRVGRVRSRAPCGRGCRAWNATSRPARSKSRRRRCAS